MCGFNRAIVNWALSESQVLLASVLGPHNLHKPAVCQKVSVMFPLASYKHELQTDVSLEAFVLLLEVNRDNTQQATGWIRLKFTRPPLKPLWSQMLPLPTHIHPRSASADSDTLLVLKLPLIQAELSMNLSSQWVLTTKHFLYCLSWINCSG